MGNAVKIGDIDTGHDGYPPTPVISGSPTVKVDGIPLCRQGDQLLPHATPVSPLHARVISGGSSTVRADGQPAARTGDSVSCGGVVIGGGTVNIG